MKKRNEGYRDEAEKERELGSCSALWVCVWYPGDAEKQMNFRIEFCIWFWSANIES